MRLIKKLKLSEKLILGLLIGILLVPIYVFSSKIEMVSPWYQTALSARTNSAITSVYIGSTSYPLTVSTGGILYGTNNTTITVLPKGTAYKILQMNAAGTFPEWTNILVITTMNLPSSAGSPQTTIGQIKHNNTTNRFELWDGTEAQRMVSGFSSRVSVQYDNATTVLGNVTGLTANVAAARTYSFRAVLFTTSNVAGGVKVAISGGCTATSIVYEVLITNAGLITQGRGAALNAAVGVTAITVAMVTIEGTITVANAGTLTVQLAQNGGPVGTTSALVGSNFHVTYIQ